MWFPIWIRRLLAVVISLVIACPSVVALTLGLRTVATGLNAPVAIGQAGDARIFVVEQEGIIRIIKDGMLSPVPFLNIDPIVLSGGERGLLGIAFHPSFLVSGAAGEGLFWVNYTNNAGDTVIARFTVSVGNPDVANPLSEVILLTIDQPSSNHNGGQIVFGPVEGAAQARYLYIGMGDGGGFGDPQNNAQTDGTLLGKMLRIDPSTDPIIDPPPDPLFEIPAGNSAVDSPVWAKGLRNPWRFSFDRSTGDLYIADVGQERREEIHVTPVGTPGGLNYGWKIMEGTLCFSPLNGCDMTGLELPVFDYAHVSDRCAVTGGFVYRGARFPSLTGSYLYADLCTGELFKLDEIAPDNWESEKLLTLGFSPFTFGEDVNGELYVAGSNGTVHQIVDREALVLADQDLLLFSPPVALQAGFSCGDLRELFAAQTVLQLVADTQQIEVCNGVGDSFLIFPGLGYMIAGAQNDALFEGGPTCPSVNLEPGLNLIGVANPAPSLTCAGLLEKIGDDTVVSAIERFNPNSGGFDACAYTNESSIIHSGDNFQVRPGEAYLVSMRLGRDAVALNDPSLCTPTPQ